MNTKNLGELIYQSNFECLVYHENDGNGHLNTANYDAYTEETRRRFLKNFDWSDKKFNKQGIAQRRKNFNGEHKYELKKGDLFNILLQIYEGDRVFFHMYFEFLKDGKTLAFQMLTKDYFVSVSNGQVKPIKIPEFFYDKIRNV